MGGGRETKANKSVSISTYFFLKKAQKSRWLRLRALGGPILVKKNTVYSRLRTKKTKIFKNFLPKELENLVGGEPL